VDASQTTWSAFEGWEVSREETWPCAEVVVEVVQVQWGYPEREATAQHAVEVRILAMPAVPRRIEGKV